IVENNELPITEIPTILTANVPTKENASEPSDAYDNQADEYDYIDYASNYESDHEKLSKQEENALTEEKKVDDIVITNSNEKDQTSITKSRRDNSSRTSKKEETIIESVDQVKIEPNSCAEEIFVDISEDKKELDEATETDNKLDPNEEEFPSESTSDKSEDNSGESKLGKSLEKNVNEFVENPLLDSYSEESEDKSGDNNEIKIMDENNDNRMVGNLSENIPESIFDKLENKKLVVINSNTIISNTSQDYVTNTLSEENIPLYNDNRENLQIVPEDHETEILPNNANFSSFSSEDKQSERGSMSELFTSKSSSISSTLIHQSIDFTSGRENENPENIIDYKNSKNRISIASLGENPELSDISLDDESLVAQESSKEWNLSDWGFPRTPTSLKSISTFFNPRSTTSTVTSTSPKSTSSGEQNDPHRMSNVSMTSTGSTGSNYDLLLARLERENQMLQEDPKAKRMSLQGIADIKASFERVQHEANGGQIDDDIDWDFWGQIISDYETVARTQPRQLSKMIQKGIPQTLRGMIWQLMSKSKDSELESTYAQLLKETSPHEKMIMRDLNRTFPKHKYFQDQDGIGQEGLFNVVKAYSLYDTDVGYCQGISFVVGPLLLNMPDEEAFCVLVRLMKFYNMRGHFLPGMDGLQLRLFQFDRLVEEMLPKVHSHLQVQGINSSMYASQWFMTLFAYKFPLSLVFRIYDTIFTEGIEAIFRFSIALLKKNEKRIVEMEFETVLEYLKSGLFENYQITHTGVLAQLVNETQYHTNDFVKDAYNIRITTRKLNKYQQAYYAQQEAEKRKVLAEAETTDKLRSSNNQLSSHVKHLEGSLQTLNREHVELANELVNTKVELAKVQNENDELHSIVAELRKTIEIQPVEIEDKLREEMNVLAEKNVTLVQSNNNLEDQLSNLENIISAALLETAAEAGAHRLGKASMHPSHSTMPSQPALPETTS
ncbi:1667_t:CDS:2, partial [Funneliformis geosporum]